MWQKALKAPGRAGGKGQAAGIKRSANRWQAAAFRFDADGGRQAPKEPWAEAGSGGVGSDGSGQKCVPFERSSFKCREVSPVDEFVRVNIAWQTAVRAALRKRKNSPQRIPKV
ncbi:hypothetical protein B0H13DRAFT_1915911 [Mycena leptocephala]|nr:hypothetical protein B0H13DRAFT_1915911 [Mycena leptocephala]